MFENYSYGIHHGEFKTGLCSKKKVSLYIRKEGIYGTAATLSDDSFCLSGFKIDYKNILKVYVETIKRLECLVVDYIDPKCIVSRKYKLIFPNLTDLNDAIMEIQNEIDKWKIEQQNIKEREEKRKLEEVKKRELCEKFYSDCYEFHITKDDNPYYELQRDGLSFACIYIDKNKNMNFLKIDGGHETESNACIPYDKLHYYERAGSIHYTASINGKASSFGGSINGATISKVGTILSGLLFGPMGMAVGAVASYKPQTITLPEHSFEMSSETKTIDDRSVILNFFSDAKRQYIDIELPADIYNFLQTHYPEKKYDIVLELEKENIVKEQKQLGITQENQKQISEQSDMDSFENKVKKLKMMYDNDLLSEEEFAKEKAKLLEQI